MAKKDDIPKSEIDRLAIEMIERITSRRPPDKKVWGEKESVPIVGRMKEEIIPEPPAVLEPVMIHPVNPGEYLITKPNRRLARDRIEIPLPKRIESPSVIVRHNQTVDRLVIDPSSETFRHIVGTQPIDDDDTQKIIVDPNDEMAKLVR